MALYEVLNESGKVFLKGPFSQADVRNRNGRIYPKDVLREAILDLQKRVSREPKIIYAELEHPPYTEINRSNACGLLHEVTWDEESGIAYCKVEILDSLPNGRKVLNDIRSGEQYGISTRALGQLNEDKIVQPGLHIITGDIVKFPSCQICTLNESETWFDDEFIVEEKSSCDCIFEKLSLAEQIELRKALGERIINLFK